MIDKLNYDAVSDGLIIGTMIGFILIQIFL